ncbi:hypothetical protein PINS_up001353 [Pythium insidiosum]|nr:hypothetical protein PINS_up001353 [Pythium insidiosum]
MATETKETMSIAGPLYRRSPRLFSKNKPGDWTLVWCELHESGELWISSEPPPEAALGAQQQCEEHETSPDSTATTSIPAVVPGWTSAVNSRRLVTLPVVDCEIAHVRVDGRDCIEIMAPHSGKKETLSSHESSYDVDWWYVVVRRCNGAGASPSLTVDVAFSG